MEIVFNTFRGRVVSFFKAFESRFSGFLGLENRVENRLIFGDVTDSEPLIWRGGSSRDLGPGKSITAEPDS